LPTDTEKKHSYYHFIKTEPPFIRTRIGYMHQTRQIAPKTGRGQGHMNHFQFWCPQSYLRNGWSGSRQIFYAVRIYQLLALGWQNTPQ